MAVRVIAPGAHDRREAAKEIWFLCRQYDANQALEWGLVNTVVALDQLENETWRGAVRS